MVASVGLSPQRQASPLFNLPGELIQDCISAAGNPAIFAVCKNLHAYQAKTYENSEGEFQKQRLTRRLMLDITHPDRVPQLCMKVREMVRSSSKRVLFKEISPLGAHQAAAILEDWTLILFMMEISDAFGYDTLDVLIDRDSIRKTMYYGNQAAQQICIRSTAHKIRIWMAAHRSELSKLTTLIIRKVELTVLPAEIVYFTGLRRLKLIKLKMYHVPDEIGALIHLREFDISFNKVSHLPRGFSFLSELRVMQFRFNAFRHFPGMICSFNRMEQLGFRHNAMGTLPENISNMVGLKRINLSQNAFKNIPTPLARLPKLHYLNLAQNVLIKRDDECLRLFGSSWVVFKENTWEEVFTRCRRIGYIHFWANRQEF